MMRALSVSFAVARPTDTILSVPQAPASGVGQTSRLADRRPLTTVPRLATPLRTERPHATISHSTDIPCFHAGTKRFGSPAIRAVDEGSAYTTLSRISKPIPAAPVRRLPRVHARFAPARHGASSPEELRCAESPRARSDAECGPVARSFVASRDSPHAPTRDSVERIPFRTLDDCDPPNREDRRATMIRRCET